MDFVLMQHNESSVNQFPFFAVFQDFCSTFRHSFECFVKQSVAEQELGFFVINIDLMLLSPPRNKEKSPDLCPSNRSFRFSNPRLKSYELYDLGPVGASF
jgi:hypothetical protein